MYKCQYTATNSLSLYRSSYKTNRLKRYFGLKIQSHGITDVTKRNERFLLLPSDSVSKTRSYFSKNSLSWSGEYCWFFKDYRVKLHISSISLIFGDQLILLGSCQKWLQLQKVYIWTRILSNHSHLEKGQEKEWLERVEIMPQNWDEKLWNCWKAMRTYVYICQVTKIAIWIRHYPQLDQV